jgi:hypothetical protein
VLLKRLVAAKGERATASLLGAWRIAVSRLLDDVLLLPWPGSLDCGPLVDGAVEEVLPAGAVYPTDAVWYRDASKTVELLHTTYTRDAQGLVTEVSWQVYDLAGTLVLTVTDTFTYSGVFVTSRTRSVT